MAGIDVAGNYRRLRAAVAAAAQQAGRDAATVRLVAVCKHHEVAALCAAYDAGARDFGESLAADLQRKARALDDAGRPAARWHFIGRLQRNKLRLLVPRSYLVHSVDRQAVIVALAALARAHRRRLAVLLQVNLGAPGRRGGVLPAEVVEAAASIAAQDDLALQGLMTVAPQQGGEPSRFFAQLRALQQTLQAAGHAVPELSMGMSGDFAGAIAEGATQVRLGTAIFGDRPAIAE